MKPRQPGCEAAMMLFQVLRVPIPADKFWKMRGRCYAFLLIPNMGIFAYEE